jgi:hypothetical protein
MGIYQKYNHERKESVYLVLCAPEAVKKKLSAAFGLESTLSRPMLMISVFLTSSEWKWRAFINYLELQLLKMVCTLDIAPSMGLIAS